MLIKIGFSNHCDAYDCLCSNLMYIRKIHKVSRDIQVQMMLFDQNLYLWL